MAELIQKVYAEALFDAACEDGTLEETRSQLDTLFGIFNQTPVFLTLLSSPAVTDAEKEEMLSSTLEGRVEPILYNFMRILAQKQRASYFPKIAECFTSLYRDYHGILPVAAITAVPMDASQKEKLTARLSRMTGKKVLLECRIDPSLIGGVLLRYDGHELDGTVRQQLDSLHEKLSHIVL